MISGCSCTKQHVFKQVCCCFRDRPVYMKYRRPHIVLTPEGEVCLFGLWIYLFMNVLMFTFTMIYSVLFLLVLNQQGACKLGRDKLPFHWCSLLLVFYEQFFVWLQITGINWAPPFEGPLCVKDVSRKKTLTNPGSFIASPSADTNHPFS